MWNIGAASRFQNIRSSFIHFDPGERSLAHWASSYYYYYYYSSPARLKFWLKFFLFAISPKLSLGWLSYLACPFIT